MKSMIDRTRSRRSQALKVALILSLLINVGIGVWFYNNEDLRFSKMTVVIDKSQDEKEDEEKPERPEREKVATKEDLEEIQEFVEEKKTEEIKADIEEMEELKEEMEELLETQLAELPEAVAADLFKELAEELLEETRKLQDDVRKERNTVNFKEGRHQRVDRTLSEMRKMDPIAQVQEFAAQAEQAAAELGDVSPNVKEEKNGETTEEQLSEEKQQQMKELSERAQDLADRARDLAGTDLMEVLQAGESLESLQPENAEMAPAELYDYAQALEQNLNQDFAAHQALDLASVTGSELSAAMQAMPANYPQRADLAEALGQDGMNSVEQLQAYTDALNAAADETRNMRLSAQSRVRNAEGRSGGEDGQQLLQARRAMSQSAMEQGSKGFADYSQQMHQQAMMTMNSGGSQSSNPGGAENATSDFGHTIGMGIGPQNFGKNLPGQIQKEALPGRRFTRDSPRQGWLFLDTWYLIGPWEKQGEMFSPPLPPEIEVDFDAEYVGKTLRGAEQPLRLRWRFLQSNTVRVTPYDHTGGSVYFAYTEVYADEPMEVLVAVASDDGAKIWINDMVIHEDEGLSPWRIDEGFRKIFLKQGYNKVLARIENGPAVCHFSVLLCPVDSFKEG